MKEESKDAAGSDQVSLPPPCEYDYAEEQLADAGEGDPLERPSAVQRQRAKQVESRTAMIHGGGWWMVWMVVISGVLIVSRDTREEAIRRARSTTCRHHFFGLGERGVLVIIVIMKRMLQIEVLPS